MYNACCGLGQNFQAPTDAEIEAAVAAFAARNSWTVTGWVRDDPAATVIVTLSTGERWGLGWANLGIAPVQPAMAYTGQFSPTQYDEIIAAGVEALKAAIDATGALPGGEQGEVWVARWLRANVRDVEAPEAIFSYGILQEFGNWWTELETARIAARAVQPTAIEVDLIVEPNPNGVPDLWNVLQHRGHFFFGDGSEKYSAWGQPGVFYNMTTAEVTPGANWSRSTWPGTVGNVWLFDQVPPAELTRTPDYPFPGVGTIVVPTAPPEPTPPSVPEARVRLPSGETVPISQVPPGTFGPGIVPITPPPEVLYPTTTPANGIPGAGPRYAMPGGGYPEPTGPGGAAGPPAVAPAPVEAGIGSGLLVGGGILAVVLVAAGAAKRRRRGRRVKGYRRY